MGVVFEKSWAKLLGDERATTDYWVNKNEIPLGTLRPYDFYKDQNSIPSSDIVTIKFDPINTQLTARKLMNVLVLGASGDMKSIILKIAWGVLQRAGFYIVYFDPKSQDAARAVQGWNSSPRLPPYTEPEGISLAPYIPECSKANIMQIQHHFRKYARRISDINQREMWVGLGMTDQAAVQTAKLIREGYNKLSDIKRELRMLADDRVIEAQTLGNAFRIIDWIGDIGYLDDKVPSLDLYKTWSNEQKSVVISYNAISPSIMSFDVGLCVHQAKEYYFNRNNRNPIIFFFDDGMFYADDIPNVRENFAKEQIKQIGFNYRSLGIYNFLAVQSLAIIDEAVAETYSVKLVSPYFANPDSLKKINIPQKAIDYIKDNVLVKDKKNHLVQWLKIDEDNNVTPFFNFTCQANHFKDIFTIKESEG